MRRGWSVLLVALAACATTGDAPAATPPPSFREVRSLVLVRTVEDRAGRQKDPLDGLDESLRARGYRTRLVELGRAGGPDHPALARLFSDLEGRAGAARAERFGTTPYARLGRGAAETVAALGVDAVASYHRLALLRAPAPGDGARLPGTLLPGPAVSPAQRPTGALAVVDRAGHVATFAWGETSALDDPDVPVNAAEAIDLVLRALSGEPAPE
jgi:hypothetical protein